MEVGHVVAAVVGQGAGAGMAKFTNMLLNRCIRYAHRMIGGDAGWAARGTLRRPIRRIVLKNDRSSCRVGPSRQNERRVCL